jgi:hypothetical protein
MIQIAPDSRNQRQPDKRTACATHTGRYWLCRSPVSSGENLFVSIASHRYTSTPLHTPHITNLDCRFRLSVSSNLCIAVGGGSGVQAIVNAPYENRPGVLASDAAQLGPRTAHAGTVATAHRTRTVVNHGTGRTNRTNRANEKKEGKTKALLSSHISPRISLCKKKIICHIEMSAYIWSTKYR